jgi:hypothetical protein
VTIASCLPSPSRTWAVVTTRIIAVPQRPEYHPRPAPQGAGGARDGPVLWVIVTMVPRSRDGYAPIATSSAARSRVLLLHTRVLLCRVTVAAGSEGRIPTSVALPRRQPARAGADARRRWRASGMYILKDVACATPPQLQHSGSWVRAIPPCKRL